MNELARLNGLFHEYADADVVKAARNTEAFANEVFDITASDNQRYFLKILKAQHPDAIACEVAMQQRLLVAGIGTPQYLEITPGKYIGHHGGERFLLSKYIPGSAPTAVSPKLITSFGSMLARLHIALQGIAVPSNGMQWLDPKKVQRDLAPYNGPVRSKLNTLLDFGLQLFELDLPQAVTHGDLWMSNVFAKDDDITTVFDLETAEETVRLVDLARTYTSMRFNSIYAARAIINGLVAGYNAATKQPLAAKELENIPRAIAYASAACGTWHAVHGTRYRDPYIQFGFEAMTI